MDWLSCSKDYEEIMRNNSEKISAPLEKKFSDLPITTNISYIHTNLDIFNHQEICGLTKVKKKFFHEEKNVAEKTQLGMLVHQ